MNTKALIETARKLLADDKGILAMDESNATCNKRFASVGIPQTAESRRLYREWIITTRGLFENISGVILYDETIRQLGSGGAPLLRMVGDAGFIPGIKVDKGTTDLAAHPGEKISEGLDGLRERLAEYFSMGIRFAKWRAVIYVGQNLPSIGCREANAHALARFAALCQEQGLVPVVEPEVLMDGTHSMERCGVVTAELLGCVFDQLHQQGVLLEGMILKTNMVLPGLSCPAQQEVEEVATGEQQFQVRLADQEPDEQAAVDEVAIATINGLLRVVPAAVPGIAFLSGGQSGELASLRLNAMNAKFKSRAPWALSFSFARAIQQPALEIWRGQADNVRAAQDTLLARAHCNRAARRGEYSPAMEAIPRARPWNPTTLQSVSS